MEIGNYRIIKQINEGGFGRIYHAKHILLDEDACIKQNKTEGLEDVEILKLEAKLLWKLNEHHSIPSTKDFFKISNNNYALVLDYIEAKTLEDIIPNKNRIHPEDTCWIIERLLSALYYCHYNGVIHGDIKPGNVFIEEKKHDIKLIDFGLSEYLPKHNTKPKGYTPKYSAPEIIQGKPPIPESDIYGVGITMLFALGGDVQSKTFPKNIPEEIINFNKNLLNYDPMQRPNWQNNNPIIKLSNIRKQVFGRRHAF